MSAIAELPCATREGVITIVDDNPANLTLLEEMLCQNGYSVRAFPRGRMALASAEYEPPDLILLDINMPEMDGYEVCRRLKANPALCGIPVVFLSALHEVEDKVKGFQSGGVDYISKPFQFEEVQARVETHLELHQLQKALRRQNEELEQVVEERTRDLAQANAKLSLLDRSKDEFLRLISHELRTPLNGVLGVAELALTDDCSPEEKSDLQGMFATSRQRLMAILDDALLLTNIDVNGGALRRMPVPLKEPFGRALGKVAQFAESREVRLGPIPAWNDLVIADERLVTRAFEALLETAVKFSAAGESIRVWRETGGRAVRLVLETRGKTVPDELLPRFFDLFAMSESSTEGGDVGLGPAVASRILAVFGGKVGIQRVPGCGLLISVSLPLA